MLKFGFIFLSLTDAHFEHQAFGSKQPENGHGSSVSPADFGRFLCGFRWIEIECLQKLYTDDLVVPSLG